MASICNDDWASLGVMSGHERKTLRLSAPDQFDGEGQCAGLASVGGSVYHRFGIPGPAQDVGPFLAVGGQLARAVPSGAWPDLRRVVMQARRMTRRVTQAAGRVPSAATSEMACVSRAWVTSAATLASRQGLGEGHRQLAFCMVAISASEPGCIAAQVRCMVAAAMSLKTT